MVHSHVWHIDPACKYSVIEFSLFGNEGINSNVFALTNLPKMHGRLIHTRSSKSLTINLGDSTGFSFDFFIVLNK